MTIEQLTARKQELLKEIEQIDEQIAKSKCAEKKCERLSFKKYLLDLGVPSSINLRG